MSTQKAAPYGSWESPITSDVIAQGSIGLGQIALDGPGGKDTYWIESRPSEGGRNVLVRRTESGKISDVTPAPYNVRTRVHEYGGGAFAVHRGVIYFSNFEDQRLYRQTLTTPPRPISRKAALRYADGVIDAERERFICVREDHTKTRHEPVNTLMNITLRNPEGGQLIATGDDFYSSPRLSPDGSQLAWLAWNHPNMPWDGLELWVGDMKADGSVAHKVKVAGGPKESIFQPEWSPRGVLYFVSDRSGWWNLYRWRNGHVEPLRPLDAEFGMPQWVFGMSTYAFESQDRLICTYLTEGTSRLALLDTVSLKFTPLQTPYTRIEGIQASHGRAVFLAGSPTEPLSIVELNLKDMKYTVLRRSSDLEIDPEYISTPEAIEFPTEKGLTAHAFFYPPRNRDFKALPGEKPPLLVISHGGPIAATTTSLRLGIQFWTCRGIAVLDVNYGGSTGYGRLYRERLYGQWGVVDVDDCANGARYLVSRGDVDANRLAITGGSAGGYTTLCALTFRNVFKAGASHFGISDLEVLLRDTHKFESHDLEHLIAPYPAKKALYQKRSPIHFTDQLSAPVVFFQGLEDKICPPNQSELMVKALRAKRLPVAYVAFEGEQHGFRRAENIKRALDGELYFYSKVFGFSLAGPVEPIPIDNLNTQR